MRTDDLIDALAERLEPVAPHAVLRRLALWVSGGIVLSAILMLARLGPRHDLATAMLTPMFWIKLVYPLALAALALWAVQRLGRPGLDARRPALIGLVILALAVLAGAAAFALAPEGARRHLLMGHSAMICPWRILSLAVPLFVAAFLALRRAAPTRPALAGLAAGLMAGGLGAFVYAFSCNESAMPFVAVWYTLPVLVAGAVGAAVGRFALRW